MKNFSRHLVTIIVVLASAFLYAIVMNVFVKSGGLFPGGFAGFSQLVVRTLAKYFNIHIPFGAIYFTLNILCTLFVFKFIGKWFAIYSIIWFTAASVFSDILPDIPNATHDPLLISVFGGCLGGAAIGIALRNNASSGGTDFLAIYASFKTNTPFWNYILASNVVILTAAGFLFGWNQALYSIIYQFCSTQVVGLLHQRFKLTTLIIITNRPNEVRQAFYNACRHGITRFEARGGFSEQQKTVYFTTINSYQVGSVVTSIQAADPAVFINVSHTERIIGNYYQKPLE